MHACEHTFPKEGSAFGGLTQTIGVLIEKVLLLLLLFCRCCCCCWWCFCRAPIAYCSISHLRHLQLQPRSQDVHWFTPAICQIQDGHICLKNESWNPVTLRRNKGFGEVRLVTKVKVSEIKAAKVEALMETYPDQDQYKVRTDKKLLGKKRSILLRKICVQLLLKLVRD